MNKNNFRPVKFWKTALMTLPDNVFFDLLRTVFGKIRTPFSKQILLNDLEKFLSQKDIQNKISGYLDSNDERVIAAIAVLDEPAPGELEIFFADEMSDVELRSLVINLEERFVIYRYFEKEGGRLSLNPVLENILSPIANKKALLFQPLSLEEFSGEISHNAEGKPNSFIFDDRIFAALFSFVSRTDIFFKKGRGAIRQKIVNDINAIFPGLPEEDAIGSLRVLGIFSKEGEQLLPEYRRLHDFADLSRRERIEYFAAAIYYFSYMAIGNSFSSRLLRSRIINLAEFVRRFIDSIDPECLYSAATLRRIIFVLHRGSTDSFFRAFAGALEKTGLLVPVSKEYWRVRLPQDDLPEKESPAIVMDTPYSFLVYPEIEFNDAITLASFSCVREAGTTVRFELDRDCAMQAFNRGVSADTMIDTLQRLSHNRLDENLKFTIHDWEKRHGEIRLLDGIVMTLSPERRYLAETKPLATLIAETLAPGVYLLRHSAKDMAASALRKAGITIMSEQCKSKSAAAFAGKEYVNSVSDNFFSQIYCGAWGTERFFFKKDDDAQSLVPDLKKEYSASILIDGFHSILEEMKLGGEERDELAARIDRRLILCESQLKDAVIRYEKLEARGLDYTGKLMIAKQAVSQQLPLEIHLTGRKGECVFGIPRALEKIAGDNILIVEQHEDDAPGKTIRISLGKISLLRRMRKSIFENDTGM